MRHRGASFENGWIIYTYAPGAAVASTVYDSAKPTTNLLLRYTGAQDAVSMQLKDGKIVSFGPQGQTQPEGTLYDFQTCFRDRGDTGHGTSTTKVAGSEMKVGASGSVSSETMGTSSDCLPL